MFLYSAAGVFLLLNFFARDLFLGDLRFVFGQFYSLDWTKNKSPIWMTFYISFWWVLLFYSFLLLLKHFKYATGMARQQLKYFILSSILGWIGAHAYFLVVFGFDVYPYLNFLLSLYPLIIGYAIIRYRLMDISVAITRTGIFVAVYSIVLGIPFAIAFGWEERLVALLGDRWWMVPLVSSTILATIGPFVYLYIQKRAENRLFQEQRRYQTTLRQASAGMGRIKDLNRLVNLIVHIVTRAVGLEHSIIYINDPLNKKYSFGAVRSRKVRYKPLESVEYESAVVKQLEQTRNPIVYEEIKQRTQDSGDLKLAHLEKNMKELDAAVVVPSFIDDKLLAIIILGNKISQKLFSEDDLMVFSILANQAALAIENAQFYHDTQRTQEQLFRAEKMATIGTMADGLSHQINNRLHALGFIAGDVMDTIKINKNVPMSDEVKEMMIDIEHALSRIENNVSQGREIVQGLLKYTRKGEEGFAAVGLDKLISAAIEMTQFKIKVGEMQILREYDTDLPKIKGNFTQLQEVFFNLIDNAYDAMMQRKRELQEEGYKPVIKVSAKGKDDGKLSVIIEDNGMGIKDEDQMKLFTPFFTTKLSSKKGTGLGLYVIQKLIEGNHGGKVSYLSDYKKGTRVYLTLPIMVE